MPTCKRGLDYVALRYSTVYGERQHYRAANALYIIETHDRVRPGERPRVIGDGSETKHFVHVSDVARANVAAFAANATNVCRQHLRAASPSPRSRSSGSSPSCAARTWHPSTSSPMRARCGLTSGGPGRSITRSPRRAIGWRPQVDMREGIRRLIAWRDAAAK